MSREIVRKEYLRLKNARTDKVYEIDQEFLARLNNNEILERTIKRVEHYYHSGPGKI